MSTSRHNQSETQNTERSTETVRHDTYRPDANVDNEQHSPRKAGRDLQKDTSLVPGAPISREKHSRKAYIDDKAQEAKSSRRRG